MSGATANDTQTPPLTQVSQIWTGEKVTKEWVLHDWPSSHEKLIDFATCGIPFGYTFDKNCEVNLYFDRHTISNGAVKTEYVALCGSVKNMRTPSYKAGMNLSVTSKCGKEYLKDKYVCFRHNSDFNGISIAKEFIPHTRNGALAIQEKNIRLFITLEPIYFKNEPTALDTLDPKVEESQNQVFHVAVEKLANMSLKQLKIRNSVANPRVSNNINKFCQQFLQSQQTVCTTTNAVSSGRQLNILPRNTLFNMDHYKKPSTRTQTGI